MHRAEVIQSGSIQAIQLPSDFHFDAAAVYLKKTPEGILVLPRDPWDVFFEGVEELSDDFMASGRQQPEMHVRDWPQWSSFSTRIC